MPPPPGTTHAPPASSLPNMSAGHRPLYAPFGAAGSSASLPGSRAGLPRSTPVISDVPASGPISGLTGDQGGASTGSLAGHESTTPHSTPPSGPLPMHFAGGADETRAETIRITSSSPPLEHWPWSKTSSPVQLGKRHRSDDVGTTRAPTTAPHSRDLPGSTQELLDMRSTPGRRLSTCPWIRDPELIEAAFEGLLMPLQLIRLLSLTTPSLVASSHPFGMPHRRLRTLRSPEAIAGGSLRPLSPTATRCSRHGTITRPSYSRSILIVQTVPSVASSISGDNSRTMPTGMDG